MVELSQVTGALLAAVANARYLADLHSATVAEQYRAHPLLQGLSVPRVRVPRVEVDLPVIIEEVVMARPGRAPDSHTIAGQVTAIVEQALAGTDVPFTAARRECLATCLRQRLEQPPGDQPPPVTAPATAGPAPEGAAQPNVTPRPGLTVPGVSGSPGPPGGSAGSGEPACPGGPAATGESAGTGRSAQETARVAQEATREALATLGIDVALTPDAVRRILDAVREQVALATGGGKSTELRVNVLSADVKEHASPQSVARLRLSLAEEGLEWTVLHTDNDVSNVRLTPE